MQSYDDPRAHRDPLPSATETGSWVTALVDSWYTSPAVVNLNAQADREVMRICLTYGMAAHTHGLARMAMSNLDNGFTLEVSPTARTAFECAITAQWLVHVPSAIDGLFREDGRQLQAAAKRLRQDRTPADFEEAMQVAGLLADRSAAADGAARNVRARFEALRGAGVLAYDTYSRMCGFTHANARTALMYAQPGLDVPAMYKYPKMSDPSLLEVLATSLVWAGRAADRFDANHARRSQLKKAGLELGVPELEQSPENWLAEQKAAGIERRAARAAKAAARANRGSNAKESGPESAPEQPVIPAAFVKPGSPAVDAARATK